jgi:hypothetical protein
MKGDGYPMGTVSIGDTQGKKPSKCISEMECPMYADILFSEMPCCILRPVRVPPNLGGFYE